MIYELEKTQYNNVLPLLENEKEIIDIKAVLETNNPGIVFADSYKSPKTALVWTKNGAFLVGDTKNEEFNDYFENLIYSNIKPVLDNLNYNDFEVSGTTDEWDVTIENILGKHKLNVNIQYEYVFSDFLDSSTLQSERGKEYKLVRITEDLLNANYSNIDFLTSGILIFWDSMENFFRNGFGWCVTYGDLIISIW
jgi:hypothetical protein